MNLEELTKHQILLLTLLVSFVTSIATGIVTVTLMDQAPPGVTNTINRVVERTVEKVVPDTKGQTASVITKETTVIVKEEDLITSSIEKGSKSIVRIELPLAPDETTPKTIALGTLVSSSGYVVTDSLQIVAEGKYVIRQGANRYQAEVVIQDEEKGLAILKVVLGEKDPADKKFQNLSFADMSALKLGQTLISVSGSNKDFVSMGVISGINTIEVPIVKEVDPNAKDTKDKAPETKTQISRIDSDIRDVTLSGTPVINVFGDMVGMMLITSNDRMIVPASDIVLILQSIKTTEKKTSQ
ncbi:hypothetical protein COW81_01570 [Candidatus Campbellbacteria bacterium CG22_combo_CG10-13_8_21_14_all_36_13]|uniref:Serine protease n=1 Tax=Candidatus Campbellbacteria bacterium CG22_combo_CG10-13_8_21_14_all_36_13 TaxID=1974529 RepID=A0A2H0DYD8_9BACT|nr:MAG: hypothetical protein COW81_01570 [Candidatus Campbellbacteria bacterium CG22_combo_CG10-13_8_21_14_all_36_13]